MKPIIVTIHINAGAAIREGRCRAGATQIALSESDLAQLSVEQRETLAKHYTRAKAPWAKNGPQWSDPLAWHAEPVALASLEILRDLLDRRGAVMAEYAAIWVAPNSGRPEDVLLDLARHLPRADTAGYSWAVVQAALLWGAERCAEDDRPTDDPPSPSLANVDDPPWAGWE